MAGPAVYALFFLSGISALVYQVVWVRTFGKVFGNDVYSTATVVAIFMCGLGAGSYAFGRWSNRRFRSDPLAPLRAYTHCELAIAALVLALAQTAFVLVSLAALPRSISTLRRRSSAAWKPPPRCSTHRAHSSPRALRRTRRARSRRRALAGGS